MSRPKKTFDDLSPTKRKMWIQYRLGMPVEYELMIAPDNWIPVSWLERKHPQDLFYFLTTRNLRVRPAD